MQRAAYDDVAAITKKLHLKDWTGLSKGTHGSSLQIRPGKGAEIGFRILDKSGALQISTEWRRGQAIVEGGVAVRQGERAPRSAGLVDVFCDSEKAWFFNLEWSGGPVESFEHRLLDS
jgi:hypothetical protein